MKSKHVRTTVVFLLALVGAVWIVERSTAQSVSPVRLDPQKAEMAMGAPGDEQRIDALFFEASTLVGGEPEAPVGRTPVVELCGDLDGCTLRLHSIEDESPVDKAVIGVRFFSIRDEDYWYSAPDVADPVVRSGWLQSDNDEEAVFILGNKCKFEEDNDTFPFRRFALVADFAMPPRRCVLRIDD